MAINLQSTPYPVMAAFNSCFYEMASDNNAQPGFKYLIRATITTKADVGPGFDVFTQLFEITPETAANGFFDASPITSLIPLKPLLNTVFNTPVKFILQKISRIFIEFAEYYNGVAYPYNISHTFYVWPASKKTVDLYKENPNYAYVWKNPESINLPIADSMMQNLVSEKVYENSSTYLSIWNFDGNTLASLTIKVYNLSGVLQTVSTINNPYWPTNGAGVWNNGLVLTDVGMPNLRAIVPDAGTNPILPSGINFYYEVHANFQLTDVGVVTQRLIKTFYPTCEPVFTPYTIHYLSRLGAWETANFSKSSSRILDRQLKQFGVYTRVPANQLQNSDYLNPIYARSTERVMNVSTGTVFNLNTGWLSEEEIEKYSDLFDSPQIYLEIHLPDANVQFECLAIPNTYTVNKRFNKRRYSLSMSFKLAARDNRQR